MSDHPNDKPQYAPSAGLVAPTRIVTGDEGLVTLRTMIKSRGDDMTVYLARPEGSADRPLVLVVSEAFGLHEHIADIARRFARAGYIAIAPDLMFRQGDPMAFPEIGDLVSKLLQKIPDDQVMADLDACIAWAAEQGADTSTVSATGFCWGRRWTWLYAAHRQLASAVVWYGIVDGKASGLFPHDPRLFPRHPVDLGNDLKAPVLGLYGGRDEAISIETIHRMQDALGMGNSQARNSEIIVYPDAGHAFFADYRESYVAADAKDGWRRCLEWLARHGKP